MPQPKLKATEPRSWAGLLAEEINKRQTQFPKDALTYQQIVAMRKKAGVACGEKATYVWLRTERKAGRVRMITGTESRDGKIVNTSRYVLGDG
jgi:hypothetical protein